MFAFQLKGKTYKKCPLESYKKRRSGAKLALAFRKLKSFIQKTLKFERKKGDRVCPLQ